MALKGVHGLIPGTCISVTLHGKRDPADVIKSRILRWGDSLGLSRGSNAIAGLLIRKRQKHQSKAEVRVRDISEDATLLALKTEDAATSQGVQMASRSRKGPGNRFSLRASRRNVALLTPGFEPNNTWVLANPFQTSDIQN